MRAGALRHLVTLQSMAPSRDAAGGVIKTWTSVITAWADIRYLNGLETMRADAPVAVARASIRIRYRPDVVASMRVLYGVTVFDIQSVLPDPTGRHYIDLACTVGANNG